MTPFNGWENFYVIVGSSAGALIGLQFVVLTLIANRPAGRGEFQQASNAFATPSVVHFGAVLLLSAIVSAPWESSAVVSLLWGIMGLVGVTYSVVVARRMSVQTVYRPVLEDWMFHAILPIAAYATVSVAGFLSRSDVQTAMFLLAAAALLLLFIGIHNSWDAVTYHVFSKKQDHGSAGRSDG